MASALSTLYETIRSRRRQLDMSQAQVAALTGKTQPQIARLEQGMGDPQISGVVQVARSLGLELTAVPIRLLPAVRRLISEYEQGKPSKAPGKLVGNNPEDLQVDDDES